MRYAVFITAERRVGIMTVFRPGGLELTKKSVDITKLKPGDKVLDIGCGLGASLEFIKESYEADVYGVDTAPEAVKQAALLLGENRIQCADACKLPFEDSSFQLVLMECVLTLIPQPEKALQEAVRVLAPGGSLVVSGLTGAPEGNLCKEGRLNVSVLTEKLEAAGMSTLLVSDETKALRQFVAEIIFEYDSIEAYISKADRELGGSVLSCNVPIKGTGYALVVMQK